ncbi:hypothetical protein Zmor_017752 [Zophobas morio]|uniref:Sulfatase N-terminal domain-containing protein n=1 Tax=Zophobas morio TaxID=2755281 RepID=A0AA38I5R2_9CUCU|nr:hypothetical protein Zmor_017752 [Zophobas morio]
MFNCLCVSVFVGLTHALPNFVFVLTDDQDLVLRSLDYMNKTTKLVANEGVTFTNFFVNSPICCPSRSTILTGKYAHNCHVYNNSVEGGCSGPEWQKEHERASVAAILKSKGNYRTFYAGKYLNQYGEKNTGGVKHAPEGYDWWLGLQGNSKYYNYTLSINGTGQFFENEYLTDQITKYALDFLNQKSTIESNFFMMLAPPACHAPFTPAPRHSNLFPDLKTLRTLPFNVTPVHKHWLVQMPPEILPSDVTVLDEIYKNRIRTLQAVDDMVEVIINKLQEVNVLSNTYFILASDNGFHIGQFTQPWDKREPYESDIHVPLLIRGPNISKKVLSEFPVAAVDILPTILDLAKIEKKDSDGQSFKDELFRRESPPFTKNILVEYWGEADSSSIDPQCPWSFDNELSQCVLDAWCKCQDSRNNTYSCLVALSDHSKFKFCVFEGGFIEAYNLVEDPHEMHNLKLQKIEVAHYYSILEQFKHCEGTSCLINYKI